MYGKITIDWNKNGGFMNLPKDYLNEMTALLGEEAQAFIDSYNDKRSYGLRVNRLKIEFEDFIAQFPYQLEPIPWCKDGFIIKLKMKFPNIPIIMLDFSIFKSQVRWHLLNGWL